MGARALKLSEGCPQCHSMHQPHWGAVSRLLSTDFDFNRRELFRPSASTATTDDFPPRICLDPRFKMRPSQALFGGGGGGTIGKHNKSVSR